MYSEPGEALARPLDGTETILLAEQLQPLRPEMKA